jgi:hypothetical protein
VKLIVSIPEIPVESVAVTVKTWVLPARDDTVNVWLAFPLVGERFNWLELGTSWKLPV